jgi:rhodanese-related sulfurtransferase/DNA-binding transcriptional ArsR family regulator
MKADDALYRQLARIGQALASAPRLALLDLLAQGPRTVETLAKEAGLTLANASQHLKVLRQARLVETERRGVFVSYRVAEDGVAELLGGLRALGERRLAEVQQIARAFAERRGGFEGVDKRKLLARVRAGEVTLIDVRPVEEYRAAHIAGALSVPLKELKRRLATLPKNREVVAYCRGPYCVLAPDAVAWLRARGLRASVLSESVAEWRAHGLPVSAGPSP